jgi:hypothetical protein
MPSRKVFTCIRSTFMQPLRCWSDTAKKRPTELLLHLSTNSVPNHRSHDSNHASTNEQGGSRLVKVSITVNDEAAGSASAKDAGGIS